MWLRPEPSPNWRTLLAEETISDQLWQQVVQRNKGIDLLNDLLEGTHT